MSKGRKHIFPPTDLEFRHTLHDDRHRLEEVDVPIVTISATFRQDITQELGETSLSNEAVFSRAHYSMALAIFVEARKKGLTAWLVDPTNYVSLKNWRQVAFVERVGRFTARVAILKMLKDKMDSLVRGRLPIAKAVEPPLKYVVERVISPIVSLHYESGNILALTGKSILQVVTDPHVRENYLIESERVNMTFAVFDEKTKEEFLQKAIIQGKKIDANRVVVTGPPIDSRIIALRKGKKPDDYKKRGLRLVFTTGGLGTNKEEIKKILEKLLFVVEKENIHLILYASTHTDFRDMFLSLIENANLADNQRVRIIFDLSLIKANQKLIDEAFGWADGFVTKPSGDMAYDAVAAGCFLLTLASWGEWEENIEKIFTELKISQKANVANFPKQLRTLKENSWIEKAIKNAKEIDQKFLHGAEKIVDLQQRLHIQ